MFEAVIFDMDGVLVDSEPVIEEAARRGLAEYSVDARHEDFLPFVGAGEDRYIGGVAEKYGLAYKTEMKRRVYEIYLEIVDGMIRTYPGVVRVLQGLRAAGVRLALASSADRIKVEANLRAAGIPEALFDALVSGEDVVNKKPAPDIFLEAARRLAIGPARCAVVEDAVNGVRAAKAAGMFCVALTTSFPVEALRAAGADRVEPDLAGAFAALSEF